jgi:formylglycine-generating enzyme required for sulfatase activity
MGIEKTGIRVYAPAAAGRIIDGLLRQRSVQGNPFSPRAMAELTRNSRIAASFCVGEVARVSLVHNLPEMVKIPAGSFPVEGSRLFDGQKPSADRVNISAFEIGRYPVTVVQYREFYDATNYGAKITGQAKAEEQKNLVKDRSKYNHPMVFVNDADRKFYVDWVSEKTSEKYDLLTAAEMEYVMRGADGRAFPWGNEWKRAPYYDTDATAPVDSFPDWTTPEGVTGLGIVWEATKSWCRDYDPEITDNPQGPSKGAFMECRGGSAWNENHQDFFRGVSRFNNHPDLRYLNIGFRLAKRV